MYERLITDLRRSYDGMADERDRGDVAAWKIMEREAFLARLRREGKRKLLDLGAGTGLHGKFFQENGLDVVCVDLSPEMVRLCRQKGLQAYARDFLNLGFPDGAFDAVFALNCLLHVPPGDLPRALQAVQRVLRPYGLFYWAQYGGVESAGTWDGDHYEPQRFFSFLTDEGVQEIGARHFQLLSFTTISPEDEGDLHVQSTLWRRA